MMRTEADPLSPKEAADLGPLLDSHGLFGALFDPEEGDRDAHGAPHAYADAARKRGVEIILQNRVLSLEPTHAGEWLLQTEQGSLTAQHVVNAGGLWARRGGRVGGGGPPPTPTP